MKNVHLLIFLSIFIFSNASPLIAQQVRFNEVASSNSIFFDEDGDSPDWFELYNVGSNGASLDGWTVTDQLDQPGKWTFPNIVLGADNYLLVWASGKDRLETGTPRTLVTQGDLFRYIVPAQAVNAQWTSLGFDDAGWGQNASGFGYGDGDDATIIPQGASSVFLRITFTISNIDAIKVLLLDIDYDDAFVAYINGVEVARANINGDHPAFNATAITDHEAMIYQDLTPERFTLNNSADVLQSGENVLCIQAHNISSSSSDFTIIPFLSAIYTAPTNEGISPPDLLQLSESNLHTNFKISSLGETLYLFDAGGMFVDSIVVENIPSNYSLGVSANNNLVYFDPPTPGLPNSGTGFIGVNSEAIVFSHPGGPVSSFSLTLSGVSPPSTIRYTLDATVPNENSPIYTSPISISQNTVVRARVFRQDYIPSQTQSHTYLINASHELPVISLVTDPDNFFDNDNGIYVLGDDYNLDFPHFGANFWEDWERPIHFSFYETNGSLGVSFDAGTKIFGGWSRGNEQRSLSIFARNEYGYSEINYPLFPEQDYSSYQAIVLRNSGNDWLNTMMRDGALTSLMKDADIEIQAYRPAVTYLNGEYWGFYNMREKINEHFLASKYNVIADSIDLLELGGETIFGDNQEYLDLIDFVESNNLTSTANYNYVKERIDVENYIIYHVAQIYFDNTDWPGNNIKFWKANNGKWRWILFDTDFGFGIWNNTNYFNNTLAYALENNGPGWPNPPWSTLLFRKLIQNITFRNSFVNRFADELNSRFLPARVSEHIDTISANISSEINAHYNRWGGDISSWANQVNNMKNFGSLRPPRIKQHILSEFGLSAYHPLTIENNAPSQGYVQVNSLTIKESDWIGDYFQGVPIRVTAIPEPGHVFSHWSGGSSSTNAVLEINMTGSLKLIPHFDIDPMGELPIVINEINYNSNTGHNTEDWVELYNPNPYYIDLSNWVFKDNNDAHSFILPSGTVIPGNGFLILAKDILMFKNFYPDIENIVGGFNFGLSNQNDAVRLFDSELVLQDAVNYLSVSPWPEGANGDGPSIELIHPTLDNSLPENWSTLHDYGSPGEPNVDIIDTVSGIEFKNLQLYPNPFTDQINIGFSLKKPSHIKAALYTMSGTLAYLIFDEKLNSGSHHMEVDLDFLSKGIYLLEFMEGGENRVVFKWVKM